jgi:outer membrane protein OmpA-like peptidoglycan-associated protein
MTLSLLQHICAQLTGNLKTLVKIGIFVSLTLSMLGCSQLSRYTPSLGWFESGKSKIGELFDGVLGNTNNSLTENYPKLSSVPPLPDAMSNKDARAVIRDQLIADRGNAKYVKGRSNLWPNSAPPKTRIINDPLNNKVMKSSKATQRTKKPIAFDTKKKVKRAKTVEQAQVIPDKFEKKPNIPKVANATSMKNEVKKLRFNIPAVTTMREDTAKGELKFKFKFLSADNGIDNNTILFLHGSSRLSNADNQIIRRIAKKALATNSVVHVKGHASMRTRDMDPVEHALANFNISIKRANAVAQALISNGVPAEKLIIDAVGASEPIGSEAMPNGERANRRAEISLSAA